MLLIGQLTGIFAKENANIVIPGPAYTLSLISKLQNNQKAKFHQKVSLRANHLKMHEPVCYI